MVPFVGSLLGSTLDIRSSSDDFKELTLESVAGNSNIVVPESVESVTVTKSFSGGCIGMLNENAEESDIVASNYDDTSATKKIAPDTCNPVEWPKIGNVCPDTPPADPGSSYAASIKAAITGITTVSAAFGLGLI